MVEAVLQNLAVGIEDCQQPGLVTDFYPEGLPEDWRYDFYFNEFRSVLVPQSEWLAWTSEDLDALLLSKHEHSVLYLRVDNYSAIALTHLGQILSDLGDWVVGFVVFDESVFEQTLKGLERPITWVSRHLVTSGWHWKNADCCVSGHPCGWVDGVPKEPKQQAALLKDFVASLPDKKTNRPFFIGGESINMDGLRSMKALAELLGY